MTAGLTNVGQPRALGTFAAIAAVGLLGIAFLPSAAHAELEVLSSSVAAYKAGAKLPDETKFTVPAGGSVSLLVLPSKAKLTITGGGSGNVTVLESNVAGIVKGSVWPASTHFSLPTGGVVQLLQNDTKKTMEVRGAQDTTARKPFGGTRGVTPKGE